MCIVCVYDVVGSQKIAMETWDLKLQMVESIHVDSKSEIQVLC